jgi:type I restriction enzyme R subunit
MLICPSRKHAVCYKLAVDEYLKKRGCAFKACVAFTGTIVHEGEKYTEETMNAEFRENGVPYDIKSIIRNNDDLRFVIVADKLQTGFDENKLCVMYIDKKLKSGVKAVQTISRLNRPAKNKRTFVMDFVNDTEDIKAYFTQYYGGELFLPTDKETDPNILFSKRDHILDYCVVTLLDAKRLYDLISANDEENSGAITSLVASISRNYKSLEEDKRKLFTAELKKFVKLFYYISAVYNNWNEDMERLAIVFSVLYNVLYEREETEKIHAGELVELVEFSTKVAQEDLTIELVAEDQAFDGISTDVAMADKTYSLIDEIIEKFNAHYANAGAEMEEMIDSLFKDEDLRMNVKNSAPSAYEYAASEKLSERINTHMLDGLMTGNQEKVEYYNELSGDKNTQKQICNRIIRKIKDWLNLAS